MQFVGFLFKFICFEHPSGIYKSVVYDLALHCLDLKMITLITETISMYGLHQMYIVSLHKVMCEEVNRNIPYWSECKKTSSDVVIRLKSLIFRGISF